MKRIGPGPYLAKAQQQGGPAARRSRPIEGVFSPGIAAAVRRVERTPPGRRARGQPWRGARLQFTERAVFRPGRLCASAERDGPAGVLSESCAGQDELGATKRALRDTLVTVLLFAAISMLPPRPGENRATAPQRPLADYEAGQSIEFISFGPRHAPNAERTAGNTAAAGDPATNRTLLKAQGAAECCATRGWRGPGETRVRRPNWLDFPPL